MRVQESYLHHMLETLRTRLLTMGARVQQALDNACYALVHRDAELAQKIIDGDCEIDAMENEIDEHALAILACAQPVAKDLRFVISTVRMVLDVERIGDQAVLIARRALSLRDRPPSILIGDLESYGARSSLLLHNALQSFQNRSVQQALEVCLSDTDTVLLTEEISRKIIDSVVDQAVDAHLGMHALLVVRGLDRVCHRAQNIAEHTYFMVQGENIKHRPHAAIPDTMR
ncbi:MAG: phosphate signaling complex protein PhoU [Deltaproteobacteria bacterium]|jgi:phosphate transport system protein|nr:phosphate signaling complex protein PhoU [Deltaproteobacteria bacterium]